MTDAMTPLAILAVAAAGFYAFATDTVNIGKGKEQYPLTKQLGKYLFLVLVIAATFNAEIATLYDWLNTVILAEIFLTLAMLWFDFLSPLIVYLVRFFTRR